MNLPAHSPLGPSSSDRWLACPGSVRATANVQEEDTEWALQGTAAHWVAEQCRRHNRSPFEYLGTNVDVKKVDGTFEPIPCDRQMVDGVQAFIDYVNDLPGDDYNEERIHYRIDTNGTPEYAFGTMDSAKATWKTLYITDLKYGEGVQVYAKENTQLMLYALGFLEKYGWLYDIEKCVLAVFQPRLDHIDDWTISAPDLHKWAAEKMAPGAQLTKDPNAPFAAGEHCRFCKIRKTCAERARYVFTGAVGELEDLDAQIAAPLRVSATLTNDQVAAALKRKAHVTKWYSDLEDYAFSEVSHGRAVGDGKVVEGRSNRTWAKHEDEVVKEIEAAGFGTDDLWTEPELLSAPKVEEKLGKKYFAPVALNKDGSVKKEAGKLAHLIDKPRGRPVFAWGDDPRPALTVSANELEDLT